MARTSILNDLYDPVPFDRVIANVGGRYSQQSYYFTPLNTGIYFFHMSMGIQALREADYNLRGGSTNVDVHRSSTGHNGVDTTSRDTIQRIEAGSLVRMSTGPFSGLFGDTWLQTTWNGVQLDGLMSPSVAFSMARTEGHEIPGPIPMPTVVYASSRSDVDEMAGTFTAPVTGIYYLSVSAGVFPAYGVRIHIRKNGARVCEMWRSSSSHNGVDTLSRATLVQLSAGDRVDTELGSGYVYSDGELQTSFSGFLYNPAGFGAVAFSAHRSTSWLSSGSPLYPVEFGTILVNTGDYDPAGHRFICSTSGYYFLHINTGVYGGTPVDFIILHNGVPIVNIYRSSVAHNGYDTIGRGIVYYLSQTDMIQIAADAGTGVYSDSDLQTSFTGFLLYPE